MFLLAKVGNPKMHVIGLYKLDPCFRICDARRRRVADADAAQPLGVSDRFLHCMRNLFALPDISRPCRKRWSRWMMGA